jgi:glycosyltransferase involved in cell wall biosynthesis
MSNRPPRASLSIVIPAYNEEDSIAAIIERTLAARSAICEGAGLSAVEVIVVSDGSSDRTSEIAARYGEIQLISYAKNRGYGAAIKTGFASSSGDYLAFLDADGTCDPLFFTELCKALEAEGADVAIGARLGPESEMPAIRRLGNRLYALMISLWGGTRITDSASGMRVLRRSSLPRIYPLPDGMHFTPAMSSIAIFDSRVKIVEIPMRYSERVGESKLHVLKDGLRFLRVIVDTALSYRPLRFFGVLGAILLLAAAAYGVFPVLYYLTNRRLEEWMIYRLVAIAVALTTGMTLIAVGVLSQQTVSVIHDDFAEPGAIRRFLNRTLLRRFVPVGTLLGLAGIALNARSVVEYATTGQVTAHWVYVLTGGLLVTLGISFMAFGVMARILNILIARKNTGLPN